MCIVQDALSRLGDLAVFCHDSFVISNKRLASYRLVTVVCSTPERITCRRKGIGKNSKGKSNIYCGV